jgi:Zn-dependent protease with chaperone function
VTHARAQFYDGRSPRARPVRLHIADGRLLAEAVETDPSGPHHEALPRSWPLDSLRWPERQRHGVRRMDLPDGSSLQADDAQAWDDLARQAGRRDSLVVRAQQSWRGTLLALLLVAATLFGLQRWGVPALARGVTTLLPTAIDATLGERTLAALDAQMFKPSQVAADTRQRLEQVLARVLARQAASGTAPSARLLLRDTGRLSNAWALPDGSIVLSDAMVDLVMAQPDAESMLIGLLGHELGHVTHRHGLTMLVQASLTSALGTLVYGDISGLLASAPLLLGQLAWSREAEREADVAALAELRAQGLDGEPMARLLELLGAAEVGSAPDTGLLSTHPDPAERIAWFRQAR